MSVPYATIPGDGRDRFVLLRFGPSLAGVAADWLDARGSRVAEIAQPTRRYDDAWNEAAFRAEANVFAREFNARRDGADPMIASITWWHGQQKALLCAGCPSFDPSHPPTLRSRSA